MDTGFLDTRLITSLLLQSVEMVAPVQYGSSVREDLLTVPLSVTQMTKMNSKHKVSLNINHNYAPNFEKVDGAYCFWSVRGCVGGCVGHTFCTYCNF